MGALPKRLPVIADATLRTDASKADHAVEPDRPALPRGAVADENRNGDSRPRLNPESSWLDPEIMGRRWNTG